jgi:hypothetical protein
MEMSTEGAALLEIIQGKIAVNILGTMCRTYSAHSFSSAHPGLTAGAIVCRLFEAYPAS